MLLSFSCSNYRSIKEEITFSMIATSDTEHPEQVKEISTSIRVLRNASLYGANGSGKSSFISAIRSMKEMVVDSMKLQPGDLIKRTPHKKSENTTPTCFKIHFIADGIRYLYGISYIDTEIKEECLYYYPKGTRAKIFDRTLETITYGSEFKKDLSQIRERFLKENRLLLSTAVNIINIPVMEKAFLFIKEDIVVYQNVSSKFYQDWKRITAMILNDSEKMKSIFVTFLKLIGSDAIDIQAKYELRDATVKDFPDDLPMEIRNLMNGAKTEQIDLKVNYEDFSLDVDEESEGIKKLFNIFVPIIDIIVQGKVLLFDEIESSLHPIIVKQIIELFITTRRDEFAQLIFSTHDAMLLDLSLFRRDQIWFTELKREAHSTDLYSLAEIKNVRKDENIMKGYMMGKYGAIPMINKEIVDILGEE